MTWKRHRSGHRYQHCKSHRVRTSTLESGASVLPGYTSQRRKERRQGRKSGVFLCLPPCTPTNSTLESSIKILISVSSTALDPPLPVEKLHISVHIQPHSVFKYQTDLTLHLIKAGGGGQTSHLGENSLYCSLGVRVTNVILWMKELLKTTEQNMNLLRRAEGPSHEFHSQEGGYVMKHSFILLLRPSSGKD